MGFDDLHVDKHVEQQLELAVPRRFTPERASPKTAGELIAADAEDRERQRRKIERLKEELKDGDE